MIQVRSNHIYRQKHHIQFLSSHFSNHHTLQFLTKINVKISTVNYPSYNYISNLFNVYFNFYKIPLATHNKLTLTDISTNSEVGYSGSSTPFSSFIKYYKTGIESHFIEGLSTFELKRNRSNPAFRSFIFKLPVIETSDFTRNIISFCEVDLLPYQIFLTFSFKNKKARVRTCEDYIRMHNLPVRIF